MPANEEVADNQTFAQSVDQVDHHHPLYIHPSDTQGSLLISIQLQGSENSSIWSRSLKIEDLMERFDKVNASRAAYLHKEIVTLTQGESSVSVYFSRLRELWDEYETLTPPPSCGCPESKKHVEPYQLQKLYQFLTGLNDSYENAKNQVLMTRPLLNLNQAYAMIINVESQRITGKSVYGSNDNNEDAVMMKTQGNQLNCAAPAQFFTPEQYQQVLQMLNKGKDTEPIANSATTRTSSILYAFMSTLVDHNWIVDTGASYHIVHCLNLLDSYEEVSEKDKNKVQLPTGEQASITHTGICSFFRNMKIRNILHIPDFKNSSVGRRLGHAPLKVLQKLHNLHELHLTDHQHCTVCPIAKQSRLPFPLRTTCSTSIFDLVHADVWGPYRLPTHDSRRYFLTLVDGFSKYIWIFLLTTKADTIVVLKNFLTMVSNQFKTTIKCLRTKNGTEFVNDQVHYLLQSPGILHQSSCVCTPQQNGLVERRHRTILDMARALRFQAFIPMIFWGECVSIEVHLLNRLPTGLLQGKSPFEALFQKTPSIEHLRVFGSLCYVTKVQKGDKLSPRAIPAVHIGYSSSQKGYILYDLHSKGFFVSGDTVFKEDIFPFKHMQLGTSLLFPILEFTDSPIEKSIQPVSVSDLPTFSVQQMSSPSSPLYGDHSEPTPSIPPSAPSVSPEDQRKKSTCPYPVSQHVSYNQLSSNYRASLAAYSAIVEPRTSKKQVLIRNGLKLCKLRFQHYKTITPGPWLICLEEKFL
ncbi:PREDICTED: uncharacterized protein LOC109211079 [Nicotiana attenuata]|uniref:uncharacterized protein LOC109211079 n=1 Tax=Nicotiana attenuata TaxID=49451 RepID=UPI00090545BB|nr:PREDICTED: uncharacterized protein LOC109211079 [Nicotiana attenuata]